MSWLLGGNVGFGENSSTTNFNQNTNTNQAFNTNTSGDVSKTLTPYQQALQSPLFSSIIAAMTPQGAQQTIAPFTAAARDSTSSTYGGLADTLRQQFMSTGGGKSGKYGGALVQGNLQRLGALNQVDVTGQQEAAALPLSAASLAASLLGQNFGETTTGASTGTSTGSSTTSGTSKTSGQSFNIGFGGAGGSH